MTCGVYLITCLPTGEQYVGRSHSIEGRWQQHVHGLNSGRHHCARLQQAWNEYGITSFSFQVLEACAAEECHGKEIEWQARLNATFTANPEDKRSRSQEISRNNRIFWEWVQSKGGKTVKDASRLLELYRDEYLAYKESAMLEAEK